MRQQFLNDMEARLGEFDEKLAQFAARPKAKSERVRAEREKTYFLLKAQRDSLRDQLREAHATPDNGWSRFKASAEKLYMEMVHYMDETCARIDGPENAGLY